MTARALNYRLQLLTQVSDYGHLLLKDCDFHYRKDYTKIEKLPQSDYNCSCFRQRFFKLNRKRVYWQLIIWLSDRSLGTSKELAIYQQEELSQHEGWMQIGSPCTSNLLVTNAHVQSFSWKMSATGCYQYYEKRYGWNLRRTGSTQS